MINNQSKQLKKALLKGKAVIILTDTVYGILALNEDLVTNIKKRSNSNKKVIRFISNINQIGKDIPSDLLKLTNKYWPGQLTIIYKKIGYRMPNQSVILETIDSLGYPIFASSANITTKPTVKSLEEAKEVFKDSESLIEFIDTESNEISNIASTIYDYDNKTILREGSIKANEILKALND